MSINSAMLAGAAALNSNSNALAVISDNIANVNTVGYKRSINDFASLVKSDTRLVGYSAGGVKAAARQLVDRPGVLQVTGSATDLSISGAGFFVVTDKAQGLTSSDPYYFTRAGAFVPDPQGYLRNSAGYYLQGWPVQADGSVLANPSDLSGLDTINTNDVGGAAEATSRIAFNANLRASTPVSPAGAAYAVGQMASGAVTPDFQRSVQIFDSLGGVRTLNWSFLKTGTNQWAAELYVQPAADIAGAANGLIASGNISFTAQGRINTATSTLPTSVAIGASTASSGVRWAGSEGVGAQTLSLVLGSSSDPGGITQFDADSVLLSTTVNGAVLGNLTGLEVDKDGFVTALFDNGLSRRVYQVPMATFANPNGLFGLSGSAYLATVDSGAFTMKAAGTAGAGTFESRSLENSNVDLANEFTGLIVTQRAYAASARIITTADEMLEELIRIKR